MGKFIDLTGQKFNHFTVLLELGNGKVLCQCDCGNRKICYKKNVKDGRDKSCGCQSKRRNIGSIVGQQFGNWIVLEELGYGKVVCQCQCENKTVRELYKKAVINGQTKSCGCMRAQNCNETKQQTGSLESKYVGQQFGEWTVIKSVPNTGKLLCRCSCGTERAVKRSRLISGESRSCGHLFKKNLTNKQFGEWTVIKELGCGKVLCNCSCGKSNNRILYKSTLLRGQSKSCGCKTREYIQNTLIERYNDICTLKKNNPRTQWQIETLNNKDKMIEYIKSLNSKVNVPFLMNEMAVNKSTILRKIKEYNLHEYIDWQYNKSYKENEIVDFIKDIYDGDILTSVRDVLSNNKEIDIYIPDKKLAIEFNGDYWHSAYFKDKYYHQNKTLDAFNKGIRLIHIFEHEYDNNKELICNFISNLLINNKILYARNLHIKEISNAEAINFLSLNHLQGYRAAEINISLQNDMNEIIAVMTFGKPFLNTDAQYEIVRLCFKNGYYVLGGTEKMWGYFINKYIPQSVVTYCDISKFTGNVYKRIGMTPLKITEPSYLWCDNHSNVVSRYTAQKHKLNKLGIYDNSLTEDEIMNKLDYMKIYNSGNLKFIWNNTDN